jgi:OmpA-OmpF porin, OOP family
MYIMRRLAIGLAALGFAAASPGVGTAQGLGSLKQKAEAAKKKIDDAARKSAADSAKAKAAADSAKPNAAGGAAPASGQAPPSGQAPTAATPGGSEPAAKADPKIWENYDFVPGNKVLFYTDFSEDKVGNFARGLKYVGGPMEVVERDDVKMLRATGNSTLLIPVGTTLPQRFTLEIDVLVPSVYPSTSPLVSVEGGAAMDRSPKSAEIDWHTHSAFIIGGGQNIGTSQLHPPDEMAAQYYGKVAHLRILMDSAYFKMYANEKRLYNNPELQFKRDTVIRVLLGGSEAKDQALFITSIRVAESETDVLYDALASKGRWVTQGILFATGKAELQPESRPVLKEIAATMKQHADLKILIEGHTDNVGSAASNLTLSDARAAAVKTALVSDFGADGDRITTKGFGDTKPAVPNATAVGRAQNRRVEVVKQ